MNKDDDIPNDLRKFYDYVENGNVTDELTWRIKELEAMLAVK